MTNEERRKAAEWFRNRAKGCPMPATKRMYEIATEALEEPSAQPDTEKICARIKAEAIKRNVEYMKHGDRYMLGFVDGMRLARRIVDGTVDDPVYFTTSGE